MTEVKAAFASWIKHYPSSADDGAVVVFPHAGGAAVAYRELATTLSDKGIDTYVVQYPRRADRLAHPAHPTVEQLAADLFSAGHWAGAGPLRLVGHCMGAVVAFEFARVAERSGAPVHSLWASAGQAPCDVVDAPPLPTGPREMLAEMVDLGGTDPRLLADEDFVELLLMAVGADYAALNRYVGGGRITADIHVLGGRDDHRIDQDMLRRWENHTSGVFTLTEFDGGHFYLTDHLDALADVISAR
ncbi:thioesterase II family protein [Mycolicibacterium aubagnense]|uniref:Thioesterase TesA n=1 Tax=Mycolicibacterium aubagnense TaxID=319707 RepID=A0ABM7IK23_9MYCO|nr:thioesterase domain-containing protein [Mycolicibacterium aubagnense]TLH66289.1 thioesterase [Mycolicibacterium aubagnense]WGI31459.1 thioesterase domain-containing protein [Mycolicibacterium aubagnense]BBX87096.1 thioesterase [Mycolicibacterium aubagnense]